MELGAVLSPQELLAVQRFQETVRTICGPTGWEIRLFGSRARGEGNEDSDLDLLVLLDRYDEEIKIQIWDAADAVFSATDILLSPQVLSRRHFDDLKRRERLIAQEIERDGILI
ncbi:MAG: nucleotidyltransferase domain-containing protein [Deltaproteobacteria bacterium]|nr:nucleotidyltransferase domain-containing protein [Deltaproteobacteria bacterium]